MNKISTKMSGLFVMIVALSCVGTGAPGTIDANRAASEKHVKGGAESPGTKKSVNRPGRPPELNERHKKEVRQPSKENHSLTSYEEEMAAQEKWDKVKNIGILGLGGAGLTVLPIALAKTGALGGIALGSVAGPVGSALGGVVGAIGGAVAGVGVGLYSYYGPSNETVRDYTTKPVWNASAKAYEAWFGPSNTTPASTEVEHLATDPASKNTSSYELKVPLHSPSKK